MTEDSIFELRKKFLLGLVKEEGELLNKHYDFCDWCFNSGSFSEVSEDPIVFRSDLSNLYIKWYYQIKNGFKQENRKEINKDR